MAHDCANRDGGQVWLCERRHLAIGYGRSGWVWGWSNNTIAQALGIDATVISRHEKGRRGISEEAALRYAKYYGVPVDYILDGPAIVMPKHDKPVAKNVPESGIPKSRGQRLHDLRSMVAVTMKLAPNRPDDRCQSHYNATS